MTNLIAPKGQMENIFTLHGTKEKIATHAVGFVLANSPSFLAQFMKSLEIDTKIHIKDTKDITIELQKGREEQRLAEGKKRKKNEKMPRGFTDIEVGSKNNFCVIIEAKKWWRPAGQVQLDKYANSLTEADGDAYLMTISQSDEGEHDTASDLSGKKFPVIHRSWKDIQNIIRQAKKNQSISEWENTLLTHLYVHLDSDIFHEQGNVCILPLSYNRVASEKYSFHDIVTKGGGYFHPLSGRYPRKPPEYLGFRWDSELHVVHKVKESTTGHKFFSTRKEFVMDEKPMWQHEHERQHVIYHLDDENHLPGNKPLTSGDINHRLMQRCDIKLLQSGKYKTLEAVLAKMQSDREEATEERLQEFLNGK